MSSCNMVLTGTLYMCMLNIYTGILHVLVVKPSKPTLTGYFSVESN